MELTQYLRLIMKQTIKMKLSIQSVSDLITNSSSEIFQFKTDLDFETVKSMIEEQGRKNYKNDDSRDWYDIPEEERKTMDSCSGMGGELEVQNWEDRYKEWLEWYIPKGKRDKVTPEIWALHYNDSLEDLKSSVWVDLDWHRCATIHFILTNFWVSYADGAYFYTQIDPETKKIVRYVTKEMYYALPENCRGENPFTEYDGSDN